MNPSPSPSVHVSQSLQSFADALPVLIAYVDRDLRYRFNNLAYEKWFGVPRETFHGRTVREMVGEVAFEILEPRLERALAGECVTFGATLAYEGAGVREVEIVYQPDLEDSGTPKGIYLLVHDVSVSRKQDRYGRFLSELSETVRPHTDPEEIVRITSRLLGARLGVNRCAYVELLGDSGEFTVHPDYASGVRSMQGTFPMLILGPELHRRIRIDRPFVVHDVGDCAHTAGCDSFYREAEIHASIFAPIHKDGRLVGGMTVHQKHARTWSDEEVDLVQIVATRCWESVERARMSRVLQVQSEANALFRAAVESANDAVLITEAQLEPPGPRIEYVNSAFTRMTGYEAHEIVGATPRILQGPRTDKALVGSLRKTLLESQSFTGETVNYRKDGSEYWVEWRISPVRNDAGEVVRWVAIQREVTERRRADAERALLLERERDARAEAERSSRIKDEFLATLSHELRTPLNALLGWTQFLLVRGGLDEEAAKAVNVIERNALAQARIIEDLLDMSRITSGKVDLDLAEVDLADVARAALESIQIEARTRQVEVDERLAAPCVVRGDASRLQQVVWNLLSNALKFTPAGGRISVSLQQRDGCGVIRVSDTGIGIPSEFLPHIFDRFRQADASRSRRFGGLGLGLALVDQITRLHSGRVFAESEGEERGATFTVEIPLVPVSAGPPVGESPMPDADGLKDLRILVVEDEPDSREILVRILSQRGAEVVGAGSAEDALERLEIWRPDVVISDIGMPGMDGLEFVRQLKARDAFADIPAIALTAYARAEDHRTIMGAGYCAHLPKPANYMDLLRAIALALEQRALPG